MIIANLLACFQITVTYQRKNLKFGLPNPDPSVGSNPDIPTVCT